MTPTTLRPGLMLVHGNHAETLRDLLVEWVTRYPLAPLENEIILAQSNGIAQWLKLAFAADADAGRGEQDAERPGLGIASALDISLPSRFLWRVYRAVLGADAVPETSPFDQSRLVWRLVRLLPEVMARPEYAPLRRFLTRDTDLRKRFQLADRLADLFDQYQVYRADWLAAWAGGEDVLIDARGARRRMPQEQRWQAALWRTLLEDVGTAPCDPGGGSNAGRATVHEAFLLRAGGWPKDDRPSGLPRRLMVFGISSLPRQSLEVVAALARWTQILVCVHNPCQHYWAEIVSDKDLLRAERARQRRRDGLPADLSEDSMHLHAHPLLAAWGKQGRDFIGLLDEHHEAAARAGDEGRVSPIGQCIELFGSPGGDTLLQQLQDDIRDLRPLAETRALWPPVQPARDASIRFHIAHSPQREVEILHDQLLAAFNAEASLRPRDVVVMVPDIDTYAPHVQAVFGLLDREDPRYIPHSVVDRGRRSTDPLVQALERLLDLPHSRLAVSDLLDLLEVPALRRRFGIAEEDLPQLHRWIREANIRWGLHAEQRASLDLPAQADAMAQHTWRFGLRRMLLGYAVGPDGGAWKGIEPCDEIGGLDAALLGPLVQLIERLDAAWRTLREPATVANWVTRLRTLLADVFTPEGSDETYTLLQLETALQEWQEVCEEAALTETLPLSVVGDHWLSRLDAGGLSQRFFGGAVTFATLMPMRAIPFRHVCLLGMNDGDYPRARIPIDFDLMGQDCRPGDRSRREDDRYLFLEALLSARDHLHISWVGRSITDNSPRPPSVLVAQLRDHLAAGWRLAGVTDAPQGSASVDPGQALLQALTQEHRLQPFSAQYFPPDPDASAWFTYAHEWRPARADRSQPLSPDEAKRHPGNATPDSRPSPASAQAPSGSETTLDDRPDVAAGARPHRSLTRPDALLPVLSRDQPLSVRELADFLKAPVKAFFRQRLGVFFELDDPAGEDQEPFDLSALGYWQLRDELIRAQSEALGQGGAIDRARTERLARIRRRGDLAPGAFGGAMAEELVAPMDNLFARYQRAIERWPHPVEEEEIRFQIVVAEQVRELADWLGGIRTDSRGRRGRVVLETSDLVTSNQYRGDRLIRHWVAHLAGHLTGAPVCTLAISPVGEVELRSLEVDEAKVRLAALLTAWHEGMRRPLPLAAKTAFAWLKGADPLTTGKVYDGAFKQTGECATDAYLARAYPDFAALCASGEFAMLAETLLRPLLDAIDAAGRTPISSTEQQAAGSNA